MARMESRPHDDTLAGWAARAMLAVVLVYAGAVKALDPAAFARAVEHYRLLPASLAAVVAVYLPWVEIAGGVGLFWPRLRRGALLLTLALCLLFCTVIASAMVRGLDITCGCFGSGGEDGASLALSLVRSMFLTLIAWWLWWRDVAARKDDAPRTTPDQPSLP
jgi:putative oxidoreductase